MRAIRVRDTVSPDDKPPRSPGASNRRLPAMLAAVVPAMLGLLVLAWVGPRTPADAAGTAASTSGISLTHVVSWALPPTDLRPDDVALADTGEVFVADATAERVYIYDLSGAFRGQWEAPVAVENGLFVSNLRLAASGPVVYALWQYGTSSGAAYVLEARELNGRQSLQTEPRLGPSIDDLAVGEDGTIYVLGGALIHVMQPSDLTKVNELHPGGSAADATRLAVLADGRFVYTRPDRGRLYVSTGSQGDPPAVWDLSPLIPRDVAVTATGLQVLVSSEITEAEPPLLLTLDTAGAVVAVVQASLLGIPAPKRPDLPWALAAGPAGHAMSLTGTNRTVHGVGPGGLSLSVLGAPTTTTRQRTWNDARLDLAGFDGAHLIALDPMASAAGVLAVDAGSGTIRTRARIQAGARGTVSEDGTLYMSPLDPTSTITRVDSLGIIQPLDVACDCPLGGALATQGGALYVTRPRSGTVAAMDLDTGANLGSIQLPDARGLWPADIALTAGGRLLTADPVASEVQIWASAGEPRPLWSGARGDGSPRRIAVGNLADGTEVVAAVMTTGRFEVRTTLDGGHVFAGPLSLPDGTEPGVDDLAVRDGLLYLADPAAHAVHVFALPRDVPPVVPTPDPTPSASHCEVSGDKVAGPPRIHLGQQATVTLTLRAECTPRADPVGADIILVLDQDYFTYRCGAEGWQGSLLELEVMAARRILDGLDVRYHRVGLMAVKSEGPRVFETVALTDDVVTVIDALSGLRPAGFANDSENGARYVELLRGADALLTDFGRPDALPVVIFMSPGRGCHDSDSFTEAALATGLEMRNRGVQIFTILAEANWRGTVGGGAAWMLELAGSPSRHFAMRAPPDIDPLVRRIHALIQEMAATSLAGSLFIIDEINPDVDLVADTVSPPALQGPGSLTWRRSLLPSSGLTMTYRVQPTRTGDVPTNLIAYAEFADVDGARRRFDYPVPYVQVVAPALYLPIAFKQQCVAARERVDVVLAIDASSSMDGISLDGRTKIEAARSAARSFVLLLRQDSDRAGLVSFNQNAAIVHALSGDLASVARAADGIRTAGGTRLHLGVMEADRMLGPPSGTKRAMVILSDGRSDLPELAVQTARSATAREIEVFVVALGQDSDELTLAAMVTDPAHLMRADDGSDLAGIYADLARELPCGR